MRFHLEAYSSSIATGTSPLLQINAVPSNIYPKTGQGFLVQQLNQILMASMQGAGAIRGQLQSASLRQNPFIDIAPANRGTVFESPVRFADFSDATLSVRSNEELDVFATQNSGGAAVQTVGLWFCDGPMPPMRPTSNLTVHATAAATLTALTWTPVTFALDQSLDPGTYAIVGARCLSATGLLFRVIPNSMNQTYRPGMTMVQAYDGLDHPYARNGVLGPWVQFATTALPQFELFATSADTAEELWLDLIQVSTSIMGQ